MPASVDRFLTLLQELPPLPNVFNPWRDRDEAHDTTPDAPAIRSDNLRRYLLERLGRTRFVFVGEAPGYQGCHFSGIAMTSERILLGGKPGVPPDAVFQGEKRRTSCPQRFPGGANEPTATIAWSLLLSMGLAPTDFLFWNAFPAHPHKPGQLLTNRAPKPSDLSQAAHLLPALIAMNPQAKLVAVGRVAQKTLSGLGHVAACVRHPAMGGATQFRAEVGAFLR